MFSTDIKRKIALLVSALGAVHLFGLFNIATLHPMAPLALGGGFALLAYWVWQKEF